MNESLKRFRAELSETVLTFLWAQWARIGVKANVSGGTRVIDPEALLLLTLECARQDPRVFDEVLDWLFVNGKWINVVRLTSLMEVDEVGSPMVISAVAATLAERDRTPKWKALAARHASQTPQEPLFQHLGEPLQAEGYEVDPLWRKHGLLRPTVHTRGMSSSALPEQASLASVANLVFKARALFGVNIRADVFAYLLFRGEANPTRIARELGYSQRRVQDALGEMAAAADVVKVRNTGKTREYFITPDLKRALGVPPEAAWPDWRALSRAVTAVWRKAFSLPADRVTPYLLESEVGKMIRQVRDELLAFDPAWQSPGTTTASHSTSLVAGLRASFAAGYRWRRLWVRREGVMDLSDGGFPRPPDEEHRLFGLAKNDSVYFDTIANTPCLVLLGEPGMGKTYALGEERRALEIRAERQGQKTLSLDLHSYSSEEHLIRDFFESASFLGWVAGKHELHVFLDSLDECLLRVDSVASLLGDKLKELPSVAGLYLRIACRTAEWPSVLEQALRGKWGEKAVGVFELVPLTRSDISQAADTEGLDSRRFLDEVEKREVVPLAFKPVTLQFLFKSFRQNAQLPAGQKELYAQGCRLLCSETNPDRRTPRLQGKLTPEQRLAVAGRIAAATILCNRDAVWQAETAAPETDLAIADLCGKQGENTVTRDDILETLGTGLFSSRGPDRMGWAHQTYAEFLAAQFLIQQGMTSEQMFALLMSSTDGGRKLVPQLHETAAWVATMSRDVFAAIMKSDPEVLLGSDIATAVPEDRAALVEVVLRAWSEGALTRDREIDRRYHKLAHPTLASQLRPWLTNRAASIVARKAAIEIAEACRLNELDSDMAMVSLDSTEKQEIRIRAAVCIAAIAEEPIKARLKPLVLGPADDDLRSWALLSCWPKHLSTSELFTSLTPPQSDHSGDYRFVLSHHLPSQMDTVDLIVALQWVEKNAFRNRKFDDGLDCFDELNAAILLKAIEHVQRPEIRKQLGHTVLAMLRNHHHVEWPTPLNAQQRHAIVESLFPLMSERDIACICFGSQPLVIRDDFPWLVEIAERDQPAHVQAMLAHLLTSIFDRRKTADIDALLNLANRRPAVAEVFAPYFAPVKLNSAEAARQRESYARLRASELRAQRMQEAAVLKPPPTERIRKLLDEVKAGNVDAWWQITLVLPLEPASRHLDEHNVNLIETHGWKSANALTRNELLSAARQFVEQRDAQPDAWFSQKNVIYRPAAAGFKALLLLAKEAPGVFTDLSNDTWRRWVPIIVATPPFDHGDEHALLALAAYKAVPGETIEWLLRVIAKENEEKDYGSVIGKFHDVFDDRFAAALIGIIETCDLKPNILRPILEKLLRHQVPAAESFARKLLALPLAADGVPRDRAFIAASLLLEYTQDGGWDAVWPAILQDRAFGRALCGGLADHFFLHTNQAVQGLTEAQIADLFVWLISEYPPEKDGPWLARAHRVSIAEEIIHFRNSLIGTLRDRGTVEACATLERLARQFTNLDWLKQALSQAQSLVRRKSWQPPQPSELFALAASRELRLVQSGDELMALVIEALHNIETRLQADGMGQFLWNRVRRGVSRPKDENAISDFVKSFLQDELERRGVVVNREVQIRRGQETDIHVVAITKNTAEPFDQVSVVIETKGCWHTDVLDAIQTQLVGRYLKDSVSHHGLYLVAWFDPAKWDRADSRRKKVPKMTLAQLQDALSAKAVASTAPLKVEALVFNAGSP